MAIKILIIEDDSELAHSIARSLQKDFAISIAESGSEGLKQFAQGTFQLVMLDLTLPDMPGFKVCQELRHLEKETPILILTGTADVEMQVTLLDAGADDYVVKPFDSRQLRARINALLRRTGLNATSVLRTHDLVIDTRKHTVMRAGRPITLRRKEYDILEYLTRNKGRAITRAMLFENVWGQEDPPSSIEVHINHLRDRVDRPFAVPLIETIHGVGYQIKDRPIL